MEKWLYRGGRPLLLVEAHEGEPTAPPAAGSQILIPLDGSVLAEQGIEPALALGNPMGAAYLLVQVVLMNPPRIGGGRGFFWWGVPASGYGWVQPTLLYGPVPYAEPVDLDYEGTKRRHVEAQRYLNGVAQRLQAAGACATTVASIAEHPAQAILDVAQQHAAALIALTTHGHSGLRRAFLGSVADKVVRGATIPVLVYRPSDHEV